MIVILLELSVPLEKVLISDVLVLKLLHLPSLLHVLFFLLLNLIQSILHIGFGL